ncbi:MAG: hypothetical protein IIC04_09655 [Proteobacteria bacterium]|nr:hypothetical protein [Pseudomonadota bacterium]
MYGEFKGHLRRQLNAIRDDGLYKEERVITSPQGDHVEVRDGRTGRRRPFAGAGGSRRAQR